MSFQDPDDREGVRFRRRRGDGLMLRRPIRHDGHSYPKPWASDLIVDLYDVDGANIGCIDAAIADEVVAALNDAKLWGPLGMGRPRTGDEMPCINSCCKQPDRHVGPCDLCGCEP